MKVSIIVPVYNAEATLARCADAILAQRYADIEVLLCDDGSADRSLALCRDYERADARVRVLALPHGGVSAARNAGISASSGGYIAFADSDDRPCPDWITFLAGHAVEGGLAVCGYSCLDESGQRRYGGEKNDGRDIVGQAISSEQFLEDLFSNRHMYQGYVWNKLFDASLIRTKHLRFDPRIAYNEDRLFLFHYLLRCGGVNYSNLPLYDYSLCTEPARAYRETMYSEIDAFEIMAAELKARGLYAAYRYALVDELRAVTELYPLALSARSRDSQKLLRLKQRLPELIRRAELNAEQ